MLRNLSYHPSSIPPNECQPLQHDNSDASFFYNDFYSMLPGLSNNPNELRINHKNKNPVLKVRRQIILTSTFMTKGHYLVTSNMTN